MRRTPIKQIRETSLVPDRPALTVQRGIVWALHCLFKRVARIRIGVDGPLLELQPRLQAYGSTSLFMKRELYEPELSFLRNVVHQGDTILDVGANVGVYSLTLAEGAGPSGGVVAFEPAAVSVAQLRRNLELNPHLEVVVEPVALSDAPGQGALFHVGDAPTTFTLGSASGTTCESVFLTTLDAWVMANPLNRIDIIKIDVEGHEPAVLRGGAHVLQRSQPLVMFEVSEEALRRNGYDVTAPFDLIGELGFDVYRLADGLLVPAYSGVGGDVCFGNLFATRRGSRLDRRLREAGFLMGGA